MNCERHLDEVDSIPEDFPSGVRPALILVARAAVVGMLTGLLGAGFLTALKAGDRLRATWAAALELWRPVQGWLAAAGLVASAATPASVAVFLQRGVFTCRRTTRFQSSRKRRQPRSGSSFYSGRSWEFSESSTTDSC